MRRLGVVVGAVAMAAVAQLAGAVPASAGTVFHTFFQGRVAVAAWTSCPQPRVGDSCFDTEVIASDARSYETSDQDTGGRFLHTSGDRVILRHAWYDVRMVDGQIMGVPTKESFGGTDVGVTVDIANRLTHATVVAPSIPMHTTDYVTGADYEQTGSVTAQWQPAGALQPIRERTIISGRDAKDMSFTEGWLRSAVATGVDDGVPISRPVLPSDTYLVSARQGDLSVYKGDGSGGLALFGAAASALPLAQGPYTLATGSAYWSDCATAAVGDTCREVQLRYELYDLRSTPPISERQAFADVATYRMLAGPDGPEQVLENERFTMTPDVTVVAAPDLSRATVSARDVVGKECAWTPDGQATCGPVSMSFTGTFTGTGQPTPVRWHYLVNTLDRHLLDHGTGVTGAATATATIDGVAVTAPPQGGEMSYLYGRLLDRSH